MARTVDPVRHEQQRHAILDAATRMIAERGVDAVTIADVLVEAGISKGALYHYFSGKDALLAALIARRLDAWSKAVALATEAASTPPQRLIALVRTLITEKSEDLALLVSALPTLQADSSASIHARLRAAGRERFVPLLTKIIEDGAHAGDFAAPSPSSSAGVVMSLLQEMAECIARGLLRIRDGHLTPDALRADAAAYAAAIPAALGSSLTADEIFRPDDLDAWIRASQQMPAPRTQETP
ncbi:TetR/AcrR family transcriptional regulator [Brachybacterium sp. FME24]|uniref:TetR/AcrR family transcriptional regulator n=1 Tax=Brachybacterium sp. FME24 TaxID=2742605 RepID=UPI001866AC15|nr:TetR/AcrR family transcriptional regulator [Brachybacterium sp. FME24]